MVLARSKRNTLLLSTKRMTIQSSTTSESLVMHSPDQMEACQQPAGNARRMPAARQRQDVSARVHEVKH